MADDRIDLEGWTLDELMQESGPMDTLASIVEDYDIDWTGREDDVDDDVEDDDDESAIIDVDLTPYGDALRFYRAGVDANHHLENLKSQWGEQWQDHL